MPDSVSKGLAPRHGRAYRDIFQLVKEQLVQENAAPDREPESDPDPKLE